MEASILGSLPPEIRSEIYLHVFTTTFAVQLRTNRIQHPLTLTCRQVRYETLGMYFSLTPFNAHLDDGPAHPLTRWLQTIGPKLCLMLREVGIWDMHMLNGTLHGVETTQRMLREGTGEGAEVYVLRPVGRQIFHDSWFLKDIKLPLQLMGIGLERFCILQADGSLKRTSQFALMRSSEPGGADSCAAMAEEFGLSAREQDSLAAQLREGRSEIRLLDGRRHIIMKFDARQRLTALRQEFIPREEEFYV